MPQAWMSMDYSMEVDYVALVGAGQTLLPCLGDRCAGESHGLPMVLYHGVVPKVPRCIASLKSVQI